MTYSDEITSWRQFARDNNLGYAAVNMFVLRTKADMRAIIEQIPPLDDVDALMQSYDGVTYRLSDFSSYAYLIDRYLLHVCIEAKDLANYKLYFPIYDLEAFRDSVKQWYTSEGRQCTEAVPVIKVVESVSDLASLPDGRRVQTASQFASGLLPSIAGIKALKQVDGKVKGRTTGEEGGHAGDEVMVPNAD